MSVLSAEQLTGRVRSHVLELPQSGGVLHPDAAAAFMDLRAAATQSDIDLVAVSTFRDFEHQLLIWNDKFHGRRPLLDRHGSILDRGAMTEDELVGAILLWSALPGASRHHWGTDIDLIDRAALPPGQRPQLLAQEYSPAGVFARLGAWLPRHCERYGFFLPYDRDRGGVRPEPWHVSFAPVADAALPALTLEVLAAALRDVQLAGAAVVRRQLHDIHARYVCAVAQPTAVALAGARH
ncbi:MAG TPA: M15 family metallopeptidase [Steroidobacteraceae bacterium]|jgi:LAS superfamily LD-carboxypeptidase LdcB|nr:M15 family metallopeptidase [Steroidobacteraceae bacterium]